MNVFSKAAADLDGVRVFVLERGCCCWYLEVLDLGLLVQHLGVASVEPR